MLPVLPVDKRLRRGSEIALVSRTGARASADGITAHVLSAAAYRTAVSDRAQDVPTRTTVIVGKAAGNAVARNRVRRRLRHSLARLHPMLPAGTQVVVRGGRTVHGLTSTELAGALDSAVRRAQHRSSTSP